MYVYMVLFVQETYMALIMHETILIRSDCEKSWIINYFIIQSLKSPFIREDWELIRREFTI